jgi:hypothetical protein
LLLRDLVDVLVVGSYNLLMNAGCDLYVSAYEHMPGDRPLTLGMCVVIMVSRLEDFHFLIAVTPP